MKLRYVTFLWPAMLAACGSQHMRVGDTWSATIGDFDMTPVYPPREDLLPGDVFLLGTDGPGTKAPNWVIRVGSLGKAYVKEALIENYEGRLTIAPAKLLPPAGAPVVTPPAKPPAKTKTPVYDIGAADDDSVIGSKTDPRLRMHTLALPELKLAGYSSVSAGGGGLLSAAISLVGGGSATSQSDVDLHLENLEEIHLPAGITLHLVRKHQARFLATQLRPTDLIGLIATRGSAVVRALCETDFRKLDDDGISLMIANGVVFAHTIGYSFNSSSSYAGSLAAKFSVPTAPPAAAPGGGAGTPAPAAGLLADQVQAQMAALTSLSAGYGANTPGLQVSFGIGKTGNLTLRKTSARPLAVGLVGRLQYTIGQLMTTVRSDMWDPDQDEGTPTWDVKETLKAEARKVVKTCRYYNADGSALSGFLLDESMTLAPKTQSRGTIPYRRS